MRLRIRTLILTVALLFGMTSTASASHYCPLFAPFHWLFGCNNGCGGYSGGCGYGGYASNPYATRRFIDDWLGYGYLRNQQGTLGHYPGRPFNCYQPSYPAVCQPYAQPAPAFAMPAPMQMPMQQPAFQAPFMDGCQDPCVDPCMQAPMAQYQPMPVPVTTYRPMTADRGHWQRVWVPRPVTTMVPQTQYMMPTQMQMQPQMMNYGCGDDCGGGMETMMHGMQMQGMQMQGMSSDAGCCGSEGTTMPQSIQGLPSSTELGMPQSNMMYPGAMSQPYAMAPYSSMNQWSPNQWSPAPASMAWSPMMPYSAMGYNSAAANQTMRPRVARREFRRVATGHQYQGSQSGYPAMAYQNQMPNMMAYPRQAAPQYAYSQPMSMPPAYGQAMYPQPQQMAWQAAPMTAQWTPQSYPMMQSQGAMPGMMQGQNLAGDIMGDHEMAPATTAAVPIVPNSFSGRTPFMRANLSNPMRTGSANRYPNSVR